MSPTAETHVDLVCAWCRRVYGSDSIAGTGKPNDIDDGGLCAECLDAHYPDWGERGDE